MTHRVELSGTVAVAAAAPDAYTLFTPTGERVWAHDWDPHFPVPADTDDTPGTVFTVSHGAQSTTWIVTASEPGRHVAYARAAPDHWAGTVTVDLVPTGPDTSTVSLTYALTALTDQAAVDLRLFADEYPHLLEQWEDNIRHALDRR
ncbi:MAG: hypothetical protein ABJA74_11895 [Lapillicoccus sp.]